MFVFGVVNASPDSARQESVVHTPGEALNRGADLIRSGASGLDLGGQATTDAARLASVEDELARIEHVLPALLTLGVPVSIDTWRPEVMRSGLNAGATIMNCAEGLQTQEMLAVAADFDCQVVIPFLHGANPLELTHVAGDPLVAMNDYFDATLRRLDRYGIRKRAILDPGTGFAPRHWEWQSRQDYTLYVYENAHRLRIHGSPLYGFLPFGDTPRDEQLVRTIVRQKFEYVRAHVPSALTTTRNEGG